MQKMRIRIFIFMAVFIFSSAEAARADVIKLNNGSEIDGVIVEKNEKSVVIEVMGAGFRKTRITVDRSLFETVEKPAAPPVDFIDALLQGWSDPAGRGKQTILSIIFIPFILPAIAIFILSLIFKHGAKEFWKAVLTALLSWGAAAALVFLLFDAGKNPAIGAGACAALLLPFLAGLVLYRERAPKAILFSIVEAAALVLSYFALKLAVPTT
jgi:hypothetical protein